jgi:hypothetical protein
LRFEIEGDITLENPKYFSLVAYIDNYHSNSHRSESVKKIEEKVAHAIDVFRIELNEDSVFDEL